MQVRIYGEPAEEFGAPLVEITGCDYLQHLTPDQADELAAALTAASIVARGNERTPAFVTIERTIVDFLDAGGEHAEHEEAEWFISGCGRISLTALAAAISTALSVAKA